jgi:hypothetical protein
MIQLYGKTYAANGKEAVSSLFNAGGTVNGFYRKAKAGVYLSDLQGNERAFVCKDGLGPVTVFTAYGKRHYMRSTADKDEAWLGVPESYGATRDGARALARSLFA